MERENYFKCCNSCVFFERFYVIGDQRYDKTEYGRCAKHAETVRGKDARCADWRTRSAASALGKKIVAERALREMFSEISAIRQIFEEEREERRLNEENRKK